MLLQDARLAPLEENLTLLDGSVVHVRAIRPDDTDRLRAFHSRLSVDSIVTRFFRYLPELPVAIAEEFTHIDYENQMALVATTGAGPTEQIVGVARYARTGPETAEAAFTVADHWQGHGISTALLHRLAAYARARGYTTFIALVMPANTRMLEVFHQCGFPCAAHYDQGTITVTLDITS